VLVTAWTVFKTGIRIHRTVALPFVLYGCATWSLMLREERNVRVFESRVLRGVFGRKREEVRGNWRKLSSEQLHYL